MKKVVPPIPDAALRFCPEMWGTGHELVIFFSHDLTPQQVRWSFCIKRSTLERLHPDLDPVAAFDLCRQAIYRAADEHMLRGRPGRRGHVISLEDILHAS
jgi:hypothetical protein